jgi:uncharacterized membrane protein YbhN (UPF0104 family)
LPVDLNEVVDVLRRVNTRRARVAAQALLAAGFLFLLLRLRSLWRGGHVELGQVGCGWLLAAAALAAVTVAGSAVIWLVILRSLGVATRRSWAAIFLQAQLAKYIPGSVWQYASRAGLAAADGVPMRAVALSLPIELASTAAAAASFAFLLLGWWGLAPIAFLAAAGAAAGRRIAAVRSYPLYLATWVALAGGFWLTARALLVVPAREIPFYAGAFAVAWLVGLVVIYAPGGLGVREAVLVALLRSRIGAADALAVSLASRLLLVAVDGALGGAAIVFRRLHARAATKLRGEPGPNVLE